MCPFTSIDPSYRPRAAQVIRLQKNARQLRRVVDAVVLNDYEWISMSGLFSFSRELRRCIAGALLSIPLAAAASAPQETFLPPQSIPLPGTMTFSKLVVADVNGDGYDDIVAIGTDVVKANVEIVLDVYLNEGKTRSSAEDVTFTNQRLVLHGHENADAIADRVKFSGGFDLQVVDLDNDGKPDILGSYRRVRGDIHSLEPGEQCDEHVRVAPEDEDPLCTVDDLFQSTGATLRWRQRARYTHLCGGSRSQ